MTAFFFIVHEIIIANNNR